MIKLKNILNEAPMDRRFQVDWEKSGKALRNHIKSELSKKQVYTLSQQRELEKLDQTIKLAIEVPKKMAKIVGDK